MRRAYANAVRVALGLLVSSALLAGIPGIATAAPYDRPAGNQRFVEIVIARALSQRGVPFTYGGGDVNGPTRGVPREIPPAAAIPGAAYPGLAPGALAPGLNTPPVTPGLSAPTVTQGLLAPVAAPASDVVGFDASGLIVYAFAGAGVKMPRSSGEQYKVGQKVLPSQALPGDLIFYGPEGTQSVALFVGNGQMVETTDSGVQVSPVRTENMTPYLVRIIA
ncbi:NlpC/P60 family peptidoglycan-binding protein RipD [Mycolicibacterium goodii]|uniref:NlpC/P60 family peptidoglycan-binding protein RipD n=1 Tax=Mycolicibacterium goodii TaxID=134601 RepID=A0ABS6I1T1_MYCGD|nr:NlpC/P60 family peptidoglycan-binding protein RipD [Mycolicibacterium goodii]OKH61838.1 hydrolase [Mycobacterium sp. SWH-M5]MBU8813231.1 NlpC/P60 family peptidoglycan-binding protein RipD [Mycolicibacterium goodii]MBU8827543.1 NlpC/P60 family peptidoglycan-binding protein RipD [Mycolicibacterium goodii]MBU8841157.1 NlpC/P60 family peptidoglycan-binding protein RipD [Mycolicibacterium goodii]PJK20375.1 NlpC/P60 family protein [Mycolicibacterium goodii]